MIQGAPQPLSIYTRSLIYKSYTQFSVLCSCVRWMTRLNNPRTVYRGISRWQQACNHSTPEGRRSLPFALSAADHRNTMTSDGRGAGRGCRMWSI
ncbi:hypothetical protein E2C01_041907 [Portunus trituberculatus]|uniref:Uncharacterized protein n=1 Tax=Portunus trituberculatus TaxID=210409 RepID=A0A5B7FKF6_PORTR|nr:hypothetical protein [Portunus trituberculatus]